VSPLCSLPALRRAGREWPGALLARRTRTVKRCSFDSRSGGLIQAILGTTYTSELGRIIFGYSLWPCWTASLSIYGAVRFVSQAYRPSIYLRRKKVSATCYPTSFALTRS